MGRSEKAGPNYLLYAKCSKCDTMVCVLPSEGCVECIVKAGREWKIDESSTYQYCDLCDGIKYYVTLKQAKGRTHWIQEMLGNGASGKEFERHSNNLASTR